jgi:predicted HicB family RNase H-like nuclease
MKNDMMEYKNYLGSVHYSEKDQILYGKVEGIRALVSYEGNDISSLKRAFEEAVDDYIETCCKEGREQEVTFKGSFNIRIRPEIHRVIAMKAASRGVSLNKYIAEILDRETAVTKSELVVRRHLPSNRLVGYGTFHVSRAKNKVSGKAATKEVAFSISGENIKKRPLIKSKKKTSKSIMVEER